jgi:hypothetical protein
MKLQLKSQLPLSGSESLKSRLDCKTIFCVVSLLSWGLMIPFWLATRTSNTSGLATSLLLVETFRLPEDEKKEVPSKSQDDHLPSFTEILIASGSDKFLRHHYERYYENWLRNFRYKPKMKILEIGAEAGRSLKLWSDYFSYPQKILGLAYGSTSDGVEERSSSLKAVSVYRGDQSKKETMDYLIGQGPWDIIIDDGSHVPSHMIFSLFSLWSSIKAGGLYIIEDLETNYWPDGAPIYGYRLNNTGIGAGPEYSVVSKIQQIQHVLTRRIIGAADLSVMPGDDEICAIEWGMNCVAIKKCSEKEATAYPPMQIKKKYDRDQMKKWIKEARRTNPVV